MTVSNETLGSVFLPSLPAHLYSSCRRRKLNYLPCAAVFTKRLSLELKCLSVAKTFSLLQQQQQQQTYQRKVPPNNSVFSFCVADVKQEMLETIVPKKESDFIMVVLGQHRGQVSSQSSVCMMCWS